jgi:hypothetical protein
MKRILSVFPVLGILLFPLLGLGQHRSSPSAGGAALRNLVLPGWGHTYAAGKFTPVAQRFFAADVAFLLGYAGMQAQARHVGGNMDPFAAQYAGTRLDGRSRAFILAVTNFSSLQDYNDEMLRRRQWNALLPETAENQWNWRTEEDRRRFISMKDRYDRLEQNKPVMLAAMAFNRIFAAASVYKGVRSGVLVQVQALNTHSGTVHFHIPF